MSTEIPRPQTATGAPPLDQKEVQSLSLKVMRLLKPSLQTFTPLLCESQELPGPYFNSGQTPEFEGFGVSQMLTLPHSFGNIYLGETFSCYISIHNHSPFDVKAVSVKIDMQTETQKIPLLDISGAPIPSFASGDSHDYIVQHEVKELKVHILICTVNYMKHDGEKKTFRKHFKFHVQSPLVIKPVTQEQQQGVFFIAQIANSTHYPIFLESVKFEPVPVFNVFDLNPPEDTNVKQSTQVKVSEMPFMKPGAVRQYLFKLEPKNPQDFKAKSTATLGKMEISWKSNLGESGRFQAGPFERKLLQQADIDLSIKSVPSHILLEQPFNIQCEVVNRSDRVIEPRIEFVREKMTGIMANGTSRQQIGKIPGGGSQVITLSLFPIKPGVQKITGIRVVEPQRDRGYDFNDLTDVWVET